MQISIAFLSALLSIFTSCHALPAIADLPLSPASNSSSSINDNTVTRPPVPGGLQPSDNTPGCFKLGGSFSPDNTYAALISDCAKALQRMKTSTEMIDWHPSDLPRVIPGSDEPLLQEACAVILTYAPNMGGDHTSWASLHIASLELIESCRHHNAAIAGGIAFAGDHSHIKITIIRRDKLHTILGSDQIVYDNSTVDSAPS